MDKGVTNYSSSSKYSARLLVGFGGIPNAKTPDYLTVSMKADVHPPIESRRRPLSFIPLPIRQGPKVREVGFQSIIALLHLCDAFVGFSLFPIFLLRVSARVLARFTLGRYLYRSCRFAPASVCPILLPASRSNLDSSLRST